MKYVIAILLVLFGALMVFQGVFLFIMRGHTDVEPTVIILSISIALALGVLGLIGGLFVWRKAGRKKKP